MTAQLDTNILSLVSKLPLEQKYSSEKGVTEQQVMMQLLSKLPASLDISEILDTFMTEVRRLIPIEGLYFNYPLGKIEVRTESQGKHKLSYELESEPESLGLLRFTRDKRFVADELETLENFISCLFYPLRNALKYEAAVAIATTDGLTGAGNRTAMEGALAREMDLSMRDRIPLSVVMFDFDLFKGLNDNYGHLCGDQVLKSAIEEISGILRKTDLLYRYGGDEFILLLHKTDFKGAHYVAEKIRRKVEAMKIDYNNVTLSVTLSLGGTILGETDSPSSLIERADHALYQAKALGRNKAILHSESGEFSLTS